MHVIVRGNDRQDTFRTEGDRLFFHRCLSDLSREAGVNVHAYVLMTNHVHLLVTGRNAAAVPDLVQRLGRRYVGYFNYLHKRTGTLWEGRYKATLVEADRYFLVCQRYIELNPVRAGIAGNPESFRGPVIAVSPGVTPTSSLLPTPSTRTLVMTSARDNSRTARCSRSISMPKRSIAFARRHKRGGCLGIRTFWRSSKDEVIAEPHHVRGVVLGKHLN